MIDLHIHSNCSDGVLEPIEILKIAQKLNLDCISITDHDTCSAYNLLEKININNYYSGKIITGCELRTSFNRMPIEILGYNIKPEIINEFMDYHYSDGKVLYAKNNNLEKLKKLCGRAGLIFDKGIKVNTVKESFALNLYCSLIKYETNKRIFKIHEWFSLEVFLRNYCSNPNSDFFVDRADDYPKMDEIIEVIKQANGLSFLAHPFVYGYKSGMDFVKSIFSQYKLDGIECYYSTFETKETEQLVDYCRENNIFVSGGSDYHGTSSKSIVDIGVGSGSLSIPDNIIQTWARFM